MDYIKKCKCDGCNERGAVVSLHDSNEVEVLALCKRCAPKNFESAARASIDAWLAGGRLG
jgi:protein-arginine kinase activator protein McsA